MALLTILALALGLIVVTSSSSAAVAGERVKFVNATGETLWIGSGESGDGSRRIGNLPTLRPGGTATIVIPDGDQPRHWRGRFFARQRCSGEPGSTFRCLVGNCGVFPDRCELGAEPVSLAEFNFDQNNPNAPWYNVSYVDAVSLAITIETPGAARAAVAGTCARSDCSGGQLLAACPEAHAVRDPQRGDRVNCVNPHRDGESGYTAALLPFAPRAYLWSTHDRVPGNETVLNCPGCADFVVTFRNQGGPRHRRRVERHVGGGPRLRVARLRRQVRRRARGRLGRRCAVAALDVQRHPGPAFTHGRDGSLVVLDKCMDVAWASRNNGARVQLAWCNGGPAQVWVAEDGGAQSALGQMPRRAGLERQERRPVADLGVHPGQANQSWRAVGR